MAKARSLRNQLLRWLLLPLLGLFLVSSVISYRIADRFANHAYDISLFDTAQSLAKEIRFQRGQPIVDLPRPAMEILQSDPYDRIYLKVSRLNGQVIAGVNRLAAPPTLPAPGQVTYYDAQLNGVSLRVAALRTPDASEKPGLLVEAAETRIKRTILTRQIMFAMLLPQALIILLACLLVWLGIQSGLRPLNQLAQAISRRSHHDLSPIDNTTAPGEVQPLTQAINDLLVRLGAALFAQQRFISDAAHQLRTPLAGLNIQLERALRAKDLVTARPALDRLQTTSRHVTRLVNQLLTLARAEPDADASRQFADVDLTQIVRQVAMDWVPKALENGMELAFIGSGGPIWIKGDSLLLSEMISNLLDNAIRYSTAGSMITVKLQNRTAISLSVCDQGPGIPPEEHTRIFERFYRLPETPGSGSGLGLAIVREIALAHGAQVSLTARDHDTGTCFTITWPETTTPLAT